ncbi:MAG TPA: DNA alkylation repair protein, partial [Calditrichia bacterium]|nr:DNA alkylation repair protein [Calditrichia bacterium]
PDFEAGAFRVSVRNDGWEQKELKERMRHIAGALRKHLPADYLVALDILVKVAPHFSGFDGMIFPDFVEQFGGDFPTQSIAALLQFTRYSSAEFAIRPFLKRDPGKILAAMQDWAGHQNFHVRRLASEGCRPRLPWAMAIARLKEDPTPILPILEKLKDDPELYVRKSVANNLNDISRDHPDLVLGIAEKWLGHSPRTDWIVKHALRSLLKAGNERAMRLFGFGNPAAITVENLVVDPVRVRIGESVAFSFDLVCNEPEEVMVRLEYAVYFVKASGKKSPKVFQIKESRLGPGRHSFRKKQTFEDRTTRKHYPGEHSLSILVNGKEKARADFQLDAALPGKV